MKTDTEISSACPCVPTFYLNEKEHGEELIALLQSGVSIPLTVTGSSMLPLLRHKKDTVWLRAVPPEPLRRGRILLFRRDSGVFVLHRIRRCMPDGRLLVNGDAQAWREITDLSHALAVVERLQIRGKTVVWNNPLLRLWDFVWYPTRPIRPILFRIAAAFRSFKGSLPG